MGTGDSKQVREVPDSIPNKKYPLTLYVLELENGKYYVGSTKNLDRRLNEHKSGVGSEWTKKHKFVKLHSSKGIEDNLDEDAETKRMMIQYGIDNVRGGSYSQINLSESHMTALQREMNHATGACLKCGKTGHWARNCHSPSPKPSPSTLKSPSPKPSPTPKPSPSHIPSPSSPCCSRCGRSSHLIDTCNARTNIKGEFLCLGVTTKGYKCGIKVGQDGGRCRHH